MTLNRSPKVAYMLVILFFLMCKSGPMPAPKPATPEKLPELRSILFAEEFGDGSGIHNFKATFHKNGAYAFHYWSEGWYWSNEGRFSYSETSINLTPSKCTFSQEPDPGCKNTFTKGVCLLAETPADIEYLYEIKCKFNRKFLIHTSYSKPRDEIGFDVRQHKLPSGAERKYQGYAVITTGNAIGEVKESVFLREGPGIDFKRVQYIVNAYDGPRLESIPAGKKVIVLARTTEKAKVKTWENYWLLVSIDDSHKYWAFGEFINY